MLPSAEYLLNLMPVFEGVLFFSDFHITTIATIHPWDLCNRNTRLRILRIEGELSGNVGRERILLHLQHASHWFHDERWDMFTLVGGDADNFGDVEFGRGRRPQGGWVGGWGPRYLAASPQEGAWTREGPRVVGGGYVVRPLIPST